jgi:hypothetical protein
MTEPIHDLHTFMQQTTSEIASEYERIRARSKADPGTAGDQGEENWAQLLRDWLPATYHVETKGKIISADGQLSPQVDIVVLKPAYPPKLRTRKAWLAGGVAAAFECKTTLNAAALRDAVERCSFFKSLYRPRQGSPYREMRSPLIYGVLAHSHSWKGKNSSPVKKIDTQIFEHMLLQPHPRLCIDLLSVADLGNWSTTVHYAFTGNHHPEMALIFGNSFGPVSLLMHSTIEDNQSQQFNPVGALVAHLTQKMAMEDAAIRDIADYYRMVSLWGQGGGLMRPWPYSLFSEEVRRGIESGRMQRRDWDEWSHSW